MFIISLILFQIIIFTVFIFIFHHVMAKNVTSASRHIEDLNQDYTKKQREINLQLDEAKQKAEASIRSAKEEAEALKIKIIKDAEAERDKMLDQARVQSSEIMQQAEKSRQFLISEIDKRVSREAVGKAVELLHDALPEQFKLSAHNFWVDELIESGFTELRNLRLPEGSRQIKIISAFSLTQAQRKSISGKLKDVLGFDAEIKEEIDEKLVAGIVISIGSLVLDGSLRNRIKREANSG